MIRRIRSRVARAVRRRLGFPLQELALDRLRAAGFSPRCLFDVGASDGPFTDATHERWPAAQVHCFEPETAYVDRLSARAEPWLHVCAALVGAQTRARQQYYHHLGASTILTNNTDDPEHPEALPGPAKTSPMITLDSYCDERQLRPDFLKIDVQGYELEVLKGAERTLPHVEVVVAEVDFIEVYRGAPRASDVVAWLDARHFRLYDICDFMRRPLDDALWQCDMVFVAVGSGLVRNNRWG